MKRRDVIKNSLIVLTGLSIRDFSDLPETNGSYKMLNKPSSVLAGIKVETELEEEVYSYKSADNGAGPMWCKGSTCIVRVGDQVIASGLETNPDWIPLNNCWWMLFTRTSKGWIKGFSDTANRTREPSPMATFYNGKVFVSVNPTLTGLNERNGPSRPEIYAFNPENIQSPTEIITPVWEGNPKFTEHSYRSFAADGEKGELILFQNIGYTHAEWAFYDSEGKWSKQGKLEWPWGAEYEKPQPIRICYPTVGLKNRSVCFLGVSDIIEPNKAWRDYKKEITGRDWDYDFRRLFFTWTDDISTGKFKPWIEIASREETCGWIDPLDLWMGPKGNIHFLWSEKAIDERLREKFFPSAKQSFSIKYAIFKKGKVIIRKTLIEAREGKNDDIPVTARFHVTPDNKLYVICSIRKNEKQYSANVENRILMLSPKGEIKAQYTLNLKKPFTNFFTSTMRAGSPPSNYIDLYGNVAGHPLTINYARIRLE